jgi:hypothetical protein
MANQRYDISTNYSSVVGIPGTTVKVSFNESGGASAVLSAALAANTMHYLIADQDVHLAFGTSPTAGADTVPWPKWVPFFFKTANETTGTLKVAALAEGATGGTLWVTPLTGVAG